MQKVHRDKKYDWKNFFYYNRKTKRNLPKLRSKYNKLKNMRHMFNKLEESTYEIQHRTTFVVQGRIEKLEVITNESSY